MSRQFTRDYDTEVDLGNITARSRVAIIGHDPTVPNGGPFGLSPQFGVNSYVFDQSVIAVTPAVIGIASTDNVGDIAAGTGALTVLLTGLDGSGNEATETVTMTGQTAALTIATFSAVHKLEVVTAGSNNANTGTLYVGTGTFTAGVPAVRMLSMEIDSNLSRSAYYVVPTGKIAVMKHFGVTVASAPKDAEIHIEVSPDGILWQVVLPFGSGGGSFTTPVTGADTVPAGEHIRMVAHAGSASTDVTAFLVLELADV